MEVRKRVGIPSGSWCGMLQTGEGVMGWRHGLIPGQRTDGTGFEKVHLGNTKIYILCSTHRFASKYIIN